MKSLMTLIIFLTLSTSLIFGQGLETFANFPETGNQYKDGTFVGQDGSTWTYKQCRGDIKITDQTPTLGRDRTPTALVESGSLQGGMGILNFDYMQAFSTGVLLDIFVNNILVATVTSSGEQNVVKNSGDILVNQGGDVVLKFAQRTGTTSGQVAIDNVTWTGFTPVIEDEPSNHVTNFRVDQVSFNSITLKWTGSTGEQLPHRYLILARDASGIFPEVRDSIGISDDFDWSDGVASVNRLHQDGENTYTFSGLEENTTYYFKIYPYTNYGEDINFKTDGTIPETSGSTTVLELTNLAEIRQNMATYMDQLVKVRGTVTFVNRNLGFFLQDAAAPWSGIYVYDPSLVSNFIAADSVVITGTVDEYQGLAEITNLTSWQIIDQNKPLPEPVVVTTGEFSDEKHESVLVQVFNAECVAEADPNGEWQIDDGSGPCLVNDYLLGEVFEPVLGQIYNVRGIGNYSFENYKIEPRTLADIELVTNAPRIVHVNSSARVPLENEDFSDTVKVLPKAELQYVQLKYMISKNPNTIQTIDMTAVSGDTIFTATIPSSAYNNGDPVEYWVYAEDVDGENAESERSGFFAGETIIPDLNQIDGDGVLIYKGYYARSKGIATVDNEVFDKNHLNVYMQDENFGGINVFKYDAAATPFISGHEYAVTGQLDQFFGLTQLVPDDPAVDIVDLGEQTVPEPLTLDIATLLSGADALLGLLIRIESADKATGSAAWPAAGNDANMTISDDGGNSQLILRIDKDTDIAGSPEPAWPQHIVGLFTQYDTQPPYFQGYQILPRSLADFSDATSIPGHNISHLPDDLVLYPAYPNPFNPQTRITFSMPAGLSGQADHQLLIFNPIGQVVRRFNLSGVKAGLNTLTWDGRSDDGHLLPSGLYFARLQSAGQHQTIKLVLMK